MALKHYSHYRNSEAATERYEVVSPALFEVYLTFPSITLSGNAIFPKAHKDILFQHVRSVSGLDGLTPTVGTVVQKYKFAERHYAAAGPEKTSLELTITYTLNLNNSHENYVYNLLRKWYNLIYNPLNGQMLTKNQYAKDSKLEIIEHDRDGSIWRKITCFDVFPSTPPTGLNEDNYDSLGDAKTVSITFIADDWVEQAVGAEDYKIGNTAEIDDTKYMSVAGSEKLGSIHSNGTGSGTGSGTSDKTVDTSKENVQL
jgi:hypothetical protein